MNSGTVLAGTDGCTTMTFPQAFAKCFDHALGFVGRAAAEKSDD